MKKKLLLIIIFMSEIINIYSFIPILNPKPKLLLSNHELHELIIMKKNGLKADMFVYKSYLKEFFKSLNNISEIICYV